jgi:hypothetical protein
MIEQIFCFKANVWIEGVSGCLAMLHNLPKVLYLTSIILYRETSTFIWYDVTFRCSYADLFKYMNHSIDVVNQFLRYVGIHDIADELKMESLLCLWLRTLKYTIWDSLSLLSFYCVFCISAMGICVEWEGRNRNEQHVEMNGCVKVSLHTIKMTLITSTVLP